MGRCGAWRSSVPWRTPDERGPPKAIRVAHFLLLKSDGPISGFAKNSDAIESHIGVFVFTGHFALLLSFEKGELASLIRQVMGRAGYETFHACLFPERIIDFYRMVPLRHG